MDLAMHMRRKRFENVNKTVNKRYVCEHAHSATAVVLRRAENYEQKEKRKPKAPCAEVSMTKSKKREQQTHINNYARKRLNNDERKR